MEVVVVGSCVQDLISYTPRFPNPGESVRGHKFHAGSGGKGANQAVTIAKLGANVGIVGRVGNDIFGPENVKTLKAVGVDTSHLTLSSTANTATATITVSDSGENEIVVVLGANNELSAAHVDAAESLIASAKLLCCQFEIPMPTTLHALKTAKKHGVTTILNPAPGLPTFDKRILQFVDILCPNENEAEMLTGTKLSSVDDAKLIAKEILTLGPSVAIVTLGANGAVVFARDFAEPVLVEAPMVTAVDTTGAGDCFVGSLAYFLVKHPLMPLQEQVRRAVAIASVSVQSPGTQTSYPFARDLRDQTLLQKYANNKIE